MSKIYRAMVMVVMVAGLLVMTSCGSESSGEPDFDKSMKKLDSFKGEAGGQSVSRSQAQAELDAARKETAGKNVETMSMEEFKKMSESQKK